MMENLLIINPAGITDEVAKTYRSREAARGVVFDQDGKVAVLPVSNHNFYKLHGGGIEAGEEKIEAFRRECLEEIGSDIEVLSELGYIIEYRSEFSIIQTSYCYTSRVIGERKEAAFTESEISQGFQQPMWIPLDEALRLVSTSTPNNYEGGFIKERDTFILEIVKKSKK